jgi:hypothetical protein
MKYQQELQHKAAMSIQCFWRQKMAQRALERRKAARRLEKRRAAALRIQVSMPGSMRNSRPMCSKALMCRRIGEAEWHVNGCIENTSGRRKRRGACMLKYLRAGLMAQTASSMITR